ncbi:hypothetical protein LA080_005418 [Diaporthe eres]|nr:hypothetical protein LA080_005418 [Diaporthe eres]
MARLTRWAQKLVGRIKSPPTSTYNARKDWSAQATSPPADPPPRAVHQRHWQQEERGRAKRDGGGATLVALLGSAGIGRRAQNQLLYDDMRGGELLEQAMFFMEDETPTYLCGEYVYDLDIITSASEPIKYYGQGVGQGFFSVILAYDVHSEASFDEVSRLYDTIWGHQKSDPSRCHILVLGLKAELDSAERRVPRVTGERFASERGCSFTECSAKSGDGVYEAFGMVVEYAHGITMQFAGDPEGRKSFIDGSRAQLARAMQTIETL